MPLCYVLLFRPGLKNIIKHTQNRCLIQMCLYLVIEISLNFYEHNIQKLPFMRYPGRVLKIQFQCFASAGYDVCFMGHFSVLPPILSRGLSSTVL